MIRTASVRVSFRYDDTIHDYESVCVNAEDALIESKRFGAGEGLYFVEVTEADDE